MLLSVAEIAAAVHAPDPSDAEGEVMVSGVTWDSRRVAPGDLYVALAGERVDGHDFAGDAVDAGAAAVLAMHEVDAVVPTIIVPDTARAFTELAAAWRDLLTGTVIGLTGSSGKTTTKNLVRDVLAHDLKVVATKANQNNELGVPRTLLAADADTQAVVVEMGMRGRGQIAELAEFAKPDWGLITNVGTSHIELLGSRDEIARAKAELFEALPESRGIAFVNAADDYAYEVCAQARLAERGIMTVFFGGQVEHSEGVASVPVCVWATDIQLDEESRPTFVMHAVGFEQLDLPEANGEERCTLELRGLHNVSNACAAAAVGLASGMTLAACRDALEASRPEAGRQQVHHTPQGVTVVDDSYNANPDSMAASLATFAAMDVSGRRIAVLGDMLELGDHSQASHEQVGTLAAASSLDRLVCVGPWSRVMAKAAHEAGMPEEAITWCEDAEAALALLNGALESGDAVLAKASHSIGLERVVEGLVD